MLRLNRLPTAKGARAIITFVLSAVVILSAAIPGGYVLAEDVEISVTVPCQPPDTPDVPFPANGATAKPINMTLDWADCDRADTYHVYFGKETDPVYFNSTVTSSYPVTGLSYNTKYYWRVVAENECGQTSGFVWSFTTRARPGGGLPPPTESPEPSPAPTGTPAPSPAPTEIPTPSPAPTAVPSPSPLPTEEPSPQFALVFWDMGKMPVVLWNIDENGATLEDVSGSSVGGTVSIDIPRGTILKNPDGGILTMIAVSRQGRPPAPPDGYAIIEAFEFQYRGATFNPYITITINFDAMLGQSDLESSRPLIAVYDPDTDAWTFLEGTIDYERHEISFRVSHFSIYAIMADVGPSTALSEFDRLNWILVAILWAAALFLILLLLKRRRSSELVEVSAPTEVTPSRK